MENIAMKHTIADISSINKNLENEKSSLLTALQLIQNDYNQGNPREDNLGNKKHGKIQIGSRIRSHESQQGMKQTPVALMKRVNKALYGIQLTAQERYTLKTGVLNNTPRCVLVHTKVCTIAHQGV